MPDLATLLLVEDNEDDILLIKRNFRSANILNPIFSVRDGKEATTYLLGKGKYSDRAKHPLPDLILLDLKMPRMDGFEFLEWVRHQPRLRSLRVIVLTTSDQYSDINRTYELGANTFLMKPQQFHDFGDTARLLQRYCLHAANPAS